MASNRIPAINVVLPGYQAGFNDSGVEHSTGKLKQAEIRLSHRLPPNVEIQSRPCRSEEESWAYRCRCTFQVVESRHFQPENGSRDLCYAMRHKGQPVSLEHDLFPIATRRIQSVMKTLIQLLNSEENQSQLDEVRRGLTSITFSSSWFDPLDGSSDCIVTLHYYDRKLESSPKWMIQATRLSQRLSLRQLHGRSKKFLVSTNDRESSTIRDCLYLDTSTCSVSLEKSVAITDASDDWVEIKYEKPDTAFYHPNVYAMKDALEWLMERVKTIVSEESRQCRLLEMYCGCGAHTIALAKLGFLASIDAVELDRRLTEACLRNIALNGLQGMVNMIQGDAGTWAKRGYKWSRKDYQILLVDPPRAGLDEQVCKMAIDGTFQHFLYISCGHEALLRDLERLSGAFEVVHCRQLDLFPRTDSIETLVHLRRHSDSTML